MSIPIGSHVSGNSVVKSVEEFGLTAIQVFSHGPRNSRANKLDRTMLKNMNKIFKCIHSSYPTVGIWNANKGKKEYYAKVLEDQFEACYDIGAIDLVVHLKKLSLNDVSEVIEILAPAINKACKKYKTKILFENAATKKGAGTYETPTKLGQFCSVIKNSSLDDTAWGICIDTAHLWSSGSDIQTRRKAKAWLDGFAFKSRIKLFHINGSQRLLNSGVDKHAVCFAEDDNIWGEFKPADSGLVEFVKFARKFKVPIILEPKLIDPTDVHTALKHIRKMK